MPKFDNQRIRYISSTEASALFFEIQKRSRLWYDISKFALHTGLRAGEIFNLKVEKFFEQHQTVTIFDNKTFKNRSIPLNQIAFAIAKAYKQSIRNHLVTSNY